ncbi:peptidylprolyl isomerase [Ancylobacter sp. FA202]|uniref:peptidylprolyl isomerase n=1 Tax=Ancylobacter sp. FA202 TaxID=1111106 RepID=UPI0003A5B4A9|nr:peptidylprolyl isomerase [Ancylobacter sp. FA202]
MLGRSWIRDGWRAGRHRVVGPLARALVFGCAAVAIATFLPTPARAQQILVLVQGQPITSFDVSQRIKLAQLTERRNLSQKEALEELIDQRLKIVTAERFGVTADKEEIEKMFARMGSRTGRSPEQLTQALAQSGLDASMLKTKMRADYVWNNYVRGRFSSAATIRDSDVFAALQSKGEDLTRAQRTTEYTVRQIVLVVGRTANPGERSQRMAEANNLRKQFTDCETGVQTARAMRETVVRDPVIRTSADMSAPVRKVMDDTPVGQMTAPEVTRAGIEMIAICNRREVVGESAQKREVRTELENKQFDTVSKKLLDDARKSAMIQYR